MKSNSITAFIKPALASLALLTAGLGVQAKDIVVTTINNDSPGAGTSLKQAISQLAEGDVIKFAIPGDGPHVIVTPLGGYPLITVNNVFIDGYSQSGSKPNSNGILGGNNANIKIVLDSSGADSAPSTGTNRDLLERRSTRLPFPGYGDSENGVFGVFAANGFKVRGLSFIGRYVAASDGDPKIYAVALVKGSKNAKVQGCWFGLKPGDAYTMENLKPMTAAVSAYRFQERDEANVVTNTLYCSGLTAGTDGDGVADVQEFNVVLGAGNAFGIEAPDLRISGNYVNVFPDGLTFVDIEAVLQTYMTASNNKIESVEFFENGRSCANTVIGTNGDGKSDGNERNIVAHSAYDSDMEFYTDATNVTIAGNYFGVGVDGLTAQPAFTTETPFLIGGANGQFRVGSNGDGVSDDLEGNLIVNILGDRIVDTGNGVPVTARRNTIINAKFDGFPFANPSYGRTYEGYLANAVANPATDTTPAITAVTAGIMTGTVPVPNLANYAKHAVDVYVIDAKSAESGLNLPGKFSGSFIEGGAGDLDAAANKFRVDLRGMKVAPGDSIAIAVTYTAALTGGTPGSNSITGPLSAAVVADIPALVPGSVESVGLTRIVPDKAIIVPQNDALGNWEPNASVLGTSTFLIEGNTFADGFDLPSPDGRQRFVVALQPVDGALGKTVEGFYNDAGAPYKGEINGSRQNGNPGRVAGDKRPNAKTYVVGAEASPHNFVEFNSGNRWATGYDRMTAAGVISRYGTVQPFTLDLGSLTPTPLIKAFDSATGRQTSGQVESDQNTRFGGDVAFLSNGNFVSLVEDRSKLIRPEGNAAVATIFKADGTLVKESFKVADGDQWANLAAFKGGFAVRNGSDFYLFDNDGNATGKFSQNSAGAAFNSGRGDGTRIASHINSPYVFLFGQPTGDSVMKLAVWDTRSPDRFALFDASEPAFAGGFDRANLAVDALNRITVSWVSKPDGYEQQQIAARVLALNGDTMTITALTPSFLAFINAAKTGDIRSVGMSIAMTTKQICVSAKGEINLQNKPANGAFINVNTGGPLREINFYTVFSHPAPAEDPTAPVGGVAPSVTIKLNADGSVTIAWTGQLVSSSTIDGTYLPVAGSSPLTVPATGVAQFYSAR